MNYRRCGKPIEVLQEWELCDSCGYRFWIEENLSPDDKCEEFPKVDVFYDCHFLSRASTEA